MNRHLRHVSWGEAGFTYVETLVAVLVATVIVGSTALFLRTAWSGATDDARRAAELRHLINADRALRTSAGGIAPPWWIDGPVTAAVEEGYRIGYLDGIADRTLTIGLETDGGTVLVLRSADEASQRYPLPADAGLAVDDRGARLTVALGRELILIDAPWGGRSLTDER